MAAQSEEKESKENDNDTNNEDIKVIKGPMTIECPFWSKIADSKRILLSGAGGGFDIYQGIPLFFTLRAMGKEVFLANYTFSAADDEAGFDRIYRDNENEDDLLVVVVSADKVEQQNIMCKSYFPEYYLSLYFRSKHDIDVPVYTFPRYGHRSLKLGYEAVVEQLDIDTVIAIDGGTDSLMKGNEYQVATVEEDYNTIFAVEAIRNKKVTQKFLICLGLGVDRYHGCSDVSTLRAIAELTQSGSYLGCIQCLPHQQPCVYYREASEFTYQYMPDSISIVGTSILTAIEGQFGNKHWKGNYRTSGSKLFINPLMSIYWIFENHGVYERIHDAFKKEYAASTDSENQLRSAVHKARVTILNNGERLEAHEDYPTTEDL